MTECFVCVCLRTDPVVTGRHVEDGQEGQPNYAGGVHSESNKLRLVEVLRALPGLEGISVGRESYL